MSRLASVYYQKFIELSSHKAWKKIIAKIIQNFRKNETDGQADQPTPSEYLRYVLDNLKKAGAQNVDQHWRPQYLSCPFCLLQFSVYAHMEDLNEDSLYFFYKSGLLSRVNFSQKLNSAHAAKSTEQSFWNQVNPELIDQLDESWSYKTDFEMFQYNVEEYLSQIGVNPGQNESSSSSNCTKSAP